MRGSSGTFSAECEVPVILHNGDEVRGVEVRPSVTSARTHLCIGQATVWHSLLQYRETVHPLHSLGPTQGFAISFA